MDTLKGLYNTPCLEAMAALRQYTLIYISFLNSNMGMKSLEDPHNVRFKRRRLTAVVR